MGLGFRAWGSRGLGLRGLEAQASRFKDLRLGVEGCV